MMDSTGDQATVAALPERELRASLAQLVEAGLIFRHGNPPNATSARALIQSRRHLLHASP